MILSEFPTPAQFYKEYWGQKPFVVKGAIPCDVFDHLIDGDTLAGLSLEEDIKSRLITTHHDASHPTERWTCEHGPFEENRFLTLGEENWSLLVQNVDHYHPDTARLLTHFNIAPRWLMDDIMVSYSAKGGSVGPHTDSYHVFLVQGIGTRIWRIGRDKIKDKECIEDLDLKVLKDNFTGEEIEVSIGDVIYIPPHIAHEGITTQNAMTFSVGFLGPKLSELMVEYGYYLEQNEDQNHRYSGEGLTPDNAGFTLNNTAQKPLKDNLIQTLQSDHFSLWLAQYFSAQDTTESAEEIPVAQIKKTLKKGQILYRNNHVKLVITYTSSQDINIGVAGHVLSISAANDPLVSWINSHDDISFTNLENLYKNTDIPDQSWDILHHLYIHDAVTYG